MPTLRIQFPEKDSPSTLVLDSAKITLGRRADNTVQIVDRTVSAFHAELIREEDHYRLHDRESTNGTRVNGEPVTDYHLREACKISFGSVECDFSPEVVQDPTVETLPTRREIDVISRENQDLKARVETLKQEIESLREASSLQGGDEDTGLLRDQLQRLVRERAELQDAAQYREREFAALRTELARVNRDRQNLQHALGLATAEITNLKTATEQQAPKAAEVEPKAQPATPAPMPSKLLDSSAFPNRHRWQRQRLRRCHRRNLPLLQFLQLPLQNRPQFLVRYQRPARQWQFLEIAVHRG